MKNLPTTPSYNRAFWNYQRGRDYDTADLNTSIRGKDAVGYFLPNESEVQFRAEQEKMNIFRQIGRILFTESNDKKIKNVLPSGGAAFVGEGEAIPEMDADIATYAVGAYKVAKITKLPTELVRDAGFDIEGALAADFGREFGKVEENACLNGSGVGQPHGLLHPTEGAEIGATVSGAIGFDDIKALYFSLGAEYRWNAVWLMSDETALHLRTLKDGEGNYLWCDSDDSILGKAMFTSPFMPDSASGNMPVLFGDFRFYWLLERGGVVLKALHEKYAVQGITAFIGTAFIDGRLVRREAVKALAVRA